MMDDALFAAQLDEAKNRLLRAIGQLIIQTNGLENAILGQLHAPWTYPRNRPDIEKPATIRPEFRQRVAAFFSAFRARLSDRPALLSRASTVEREIIETRKMRDLLCHARLRIDYHDYSSVKCEFKTDSPAMFREMATQQMKERRSRGLPATKEDYLSALLFLERLGEGTATFTVDQIEEAAFVTVPNLILDVINLDEENSGYWDARSRTK